MKRKIPSLQKKMESSTKPFIRKRKKVFKILKK
jgi:hypothetical protein